MIINCICGKKKFKLADELMPSEGSKVRCGSCSEVWFYHPNQGNLATSEESVSDATPEIPPIEENFKEDEFDASISEIQEEGSETKEELKTFKILFTDDDSGSSFKRRNG